MDTENKKEQEMIVTLQEFRHILLNEVLKMEKHVKDLECSIKIISSGLKEYIAKSKEILGDDCG